MPASDPLNPSLETARFMSWLVSECGYKDVTLLPDGRWAAIRQLLFTHAIIIGDVGDEFLEIDRWCYRSYGAAFLALLAWDGTGEPAGWHRHPASGRRVLADQSLAVWD